MSQRHYAIMWIDTRGVAMWARSTRVREATRAARHVRGVVYAVNYGVRDAWTAIRLFLNGGAHA